MLVLNLITCRSGSLIMIVCMLAKRLKREALPLTFRYVVCITVQKVQMRVFLCISNESLVFILNSYPVRALDMQSWLWENTRIRRIAWAMVNAVITWCSTLAGAIRVMLILNCAWASLFPDHLRTAATLDEVRQAWWETGTTIRRTSGGCFLSALFK